MPVIKKRTVISFTLLGGTGTNIGGFVLLLVLTVN
jgi:hypothetical protein